MSRLIMSRLIWIYAVFKFTCLGALRRMETPPCFSAILQRGATFVFSCLIPWKTALPGWDQLLKEITSPRATKACL